MTDLIGVEERTKKLVIERQGVLPTGHYFKLSRASTHFCHQFYDQPFIGGGGVDYIWAIYSQL